MAFDMSNLPRLLRSEDICEIFGISRRTLDDWVALGRIPAGFKNGKRRYWTEHEIQCFLEGKYRVAN